MINIDKFLDEKQGRFIGRVYLLVILFIGNVLIPVGAVIKYFYDGSSVILYAGLAISIVMIAVLSKPYNLNNYKEK